MESIERLFQDLETQHPKRFSPEQIHEFTSNLSVTLGSGAFGDVYKGTLHNGVHVAVKVLKGGILSDQFKAEVSVLCNTHHRNLVKLYGFCFEHNMKALVYEFMVNGSLDKILFGNQTTEWETLCNIAIGTANGLSYLHEDCQPTIIHYDIKPSNILLNSNFSPKVGDFGLAKLLDQGMTHITESRFRGTPNYVAPELCMPYSPVTHKCDVYSYGITLFDIIGRRRHLPGEGRKWFPSQVWKQFQEEKQDVLMEECGIQEKDREQAKRILLIALWCVQFLPDARPSMSEVVRLLKGREEVEMPPNPFLYLGSSSRTQVESSITKTRLTIRQEDHKKKTKEAHLYINIKVARDEDLLKQIGNEIYFDLVDHDKVHCFRLKKSTRFCTFKDEVAKEFHIPVQFQRYWSWARRNNGTYRPTNPVTLKEETTLVDGFVEVSRTAELNLFLEVEHGQVLRPIRPPIIYDDDIIIFFKFYDPKSVILSYVGRLFVKLKSTPSEILTKLNVMAGLSSDQEIELYEEIRFEPSVQCEYMDKKRTFQFSQIQNGDIICFQESSFSQGPQHYSYPDVANFFDHIKVARNR